MPEGSGAARRGDARGALRQPEADVDRRHLLRAARRVPRAGRPAPGPRVDRRHPAVVLPAAGGVALPGHLPGPPGRDAAAPRRVGGSRGRGAARPATTWRASTSSRSPTATTRWARSAGARRPGRRRGRLRPRPRARPRPAAGARAAAPRAGPGRRGARRRSPPPSPAFGGSRLERAPLHAAQVEIALAAGDVEPPRRPPTRSMETARRVRQPRAARRRQRAQGAVALARGQAVAALALAAGGVHALAGARRARTRPPARRVLLADAYGRSATTTPPSGNGPRPRAASSASGRRRAACPGRRWSRPTPRRHGLSPREVEVLALVAAGQSNRDVAAGCSSARRPSPATCRTSSPSSACRRARRATAFALRARPRG